MVTRTPTDVEDPAQLARWIEPCVRAWPTLPIDATWLRHEYAGMGEDVVRCVLLEHPGGTASALLERSRWNAPDAPRFLLANVPASIEADVRRELLEEALAWAAEVLDHGDERVLRTSVAADDALAALLRGRGFEEVERCIDVALDVPRSAAEPVAVPAGYAVVGASERRDAARDAWRIQRATAGDVPADEPEVVPGWKEWHERYWSQPSRRPDSTFFAVHVADGRGDEPPAVGYADLLAVAQRPHDAWHEYTAVLAEHRGLGLASALKRATIEWARANDVTRLYTENEARNAPMRAINRRLGYRPIPARVVLRGDVVAATGTPARVRG